MKQAMKKSKDASGIMSLNKNLVNDVDNTVKKWVDSAKIQGQDIDKMGEQEIQYIFELNKPKATPHTLEELVEKLGLNDPKKNKFLQKEADVFDLTGKKIDTSKPILGGKNVPEGGPEVSGIDALLKSDFNKAAGTTDVVTETIAVIKSKKPIDAMKEANSVIGRKGKYKNLTPEESKKILKDTEDHIFERDIKYDEFGDPIKPDPEDFAHGGRTGSGLNYLLGEDDQNTRVPYGSGDRVWTQEDFNQYLKDRQQMEKEKQKKDFLDDFEKWKKWKETEGGTIGFAAEGGRIGLKKGSKKSWRDRIAGWTGGVNVMAGEAGLETWDLLNNLLQSGGLYAEGGRTGFGIGGMSRRAFLKLMGGTAAGVGAAKSGILGFLKSSKPSVIKELTSVPIKAGADGMPAWFKPLVNKVIKEGDDVSKRLATQDRQIVHQSTLPDSKTPVTVTQDLTSGNVSVDVGMGKHGFEAGHLGQPVRLEYRASEVIEPTIKKGKEIKGTKTKEEFWVEEAEFTGGHPENVKFEESISEKFGQHGSDFSEVEKFATGKVTKAGTKRFIGKPDPGSSMKDDLDFASGGRVPLADGTRDALDPEHMEKTDWIKKRRQELIEQGIIKRKSFSEQDIIPPENYLLEAIQNPEIYFPTENTPEELENIKRNLRLKQEVKDGGRVPMIFGGSTGLKAMWKTLLKNISKGRDKPVQKFFPKTSVEDKEILKMGETYNLPGAKSWSSQELALKLEGVDHLIARLKLDKKMIEQVAANKAMKDEGLDFLMKHLEKSDLGFPKYLNKYTDIDKDILQLETIKKNLVMKDRKLNATGGLAHMLGE